MELGRSLICERSLLCRHTQQYNITLIFGESYTEVNIGF